MAGFLSSAGMRETVPSRWSKPVESVRGWTASQVLTSPLFGLESTRDPDTELLIREHADLTAKERAGKLDSDRANGIAARRHKNNWRLPCPRPAKRSTRCAHSRIWPPTSIKPPNRLKGSKK